MIQQQLKTGSLYGEHDHPENPEKYKQMVQNRYE